MNPLIRESFYAHLGGPVVRRTHFFRGRFENIYLPLELMPEVSNVLIFVKHAAGEVLGHSANDIRVGFWFNLMQPGEVTTRHTHDDDDELLSAVYYLTVPRDSGELILYPPRGPVYILPQEGRLLLFSPDLPHEVSENCSTESRLSIGMNMARCELNVVAADTDREI